MVFCQLFWIFNIHEHAICEQRQFYILLSSQYSFPLPSISCLIALARTSSMMLKSGDERVHPFLVPDLSEKVSGFSVLSMRLTIVF